MNGERDPLDLEIRRFAAAAPPPERATLRAELLAEFDREFRPLRPARRRQAVVAALAAAALLLVAVMLGSVSETGPALPPEGEVLLERLSARLDRLAASVELRVAGASPRLAAAVRPGAAGSAVPMAESAAERFQRVYEMLDRDPALLRLAGARGFESIDPAGAAARYRGLLDQYGDGPGAEVARARLRMLDHEKHPITNP